jgi:gliding motility-associated lipoprotein GldH
MFTSRHRWIVFVPVLTLLFFISCDSKRFFEENKIIGNGVWNKEERIRFEVPVTDTASSYDFYINVRNDGTYPFSNLFFFIRTIAPDGRISRDTIECRLADDYGKWLGTGMGSLKFNRFLFQKNVPLRQKGTYVFEFEQAMREKELKGIRDMGLRIEKH